MTYRFLVFCSATYYPSCGWNDFDSAHETKDAAEARRQKIHTPYSMSHVVDLETGNIVIEQYEGNSVEHL